MVKSLAKKDYWDSYYKNSNFQKMSENDPLSVWIEKYIPQTMGSCFEIGCYPGRYLSIFGDHGYELNGIDVYPSVQDALPSWLKSQGYKIGNFYQADFFEFKSEIKFDLVCSFGFIEHFTDFRKAIKRHIEFVADNGYLIITTPNFKGFWQWWLHKLLDSENLKRHNINSMNPQIWARLLEADNFEIIFSGYFGKYDFWVDRQKRNFASRKLLKLINIFKPIMARFLPQGKESYSPYCGIIARKIAKNYHS